MITRCGLNRLRQFSTFLGHHLRNSKTNPKLLQALAQLDEAQYTGLALGREEEAWAIQNGVNLRVSCYTSAIADDLIPKIYRMSLDALKSAVYWSQLAERVRVHLSWSLSKGQCVASSLSSPMTSPQYLLPPTRTLLVDSWSS